MGTGHPSENRRGVRQNLLGQKFGKWLVVSEAEKIVSKARNGFRYRKQWNCICDCGNKSIVPTSTLTTGQSLSCGCLVSENKKSEQEKRKYQAEWAKASRAKHPARSVNRKINHYCNRVTPGWLTQHDWSVMDAFYFLAKHLTEQTGVRYEVDHIIPLQGEFVSGLHVPWNLQIITKSLNSAKRNRYAEPSGD